MPTKKKDDNLLEITPYDDEPGIFSTARDNLEKNYTKAKGTTTDFIREKPFTAVAIGALVGALVALGVNALIPRRKTTLWENIRERW